MTVPTKLVIHYGKYTSPESIAAVFRSLRSHLEREDEDAGPDPFATEEGLLEALQLRAVLDKRINAAEDVEDRSRGRRRRERSA